MSWRGREPGLRSLTGTCLPAIDQVWILHRALGGLRALECHESEAAGPPRHLIAHDHLHPEKGNRVRATEPRASPRPRHPPLRGSGHTDGSGLGVSLRGGRWNELGAQDLPDSKLDRTHLPLCPMRARRGKAWTLVPACVKSDARCSGQGGHRPRRTADHTHLGGPAPLELGSANSSSEEAILDIHD